MKIIKRELQFEECLKQRIELICKFSKANTTFITVVLEKHLKSI